jgi:hypothetical protein
MFTSSKGPLHLCVQAIIMKAYNQYEEMCQHYSSNVNTQSHGSLPCYFGSIFLSQKIRADKRIKKIKAHKAYHLLCYFGSYHRDRERRKKKWDKIL